MENQLLFSKRLKEAREAKGLKQRELAERIGVSYQTVSSYEKADASGKVKSPTLDNATAIAKELGVSLDWLCGIEESERQFKTYGDIAKAIVAISQKATLWIEDRPVNGSSFSADDSGTFLFFADGVMQNFLSEWEKMRSLREENTIDENLYQLWLKDRFSKMDSSEF